MKQGLRGRTIWTVGGWKTRLLAGGMMFAGGVLFAYISVRSGSSRPALVGLGVVVTLVWFADRLLTPLLGEVQILTPARRRAAAGLAAAAIGCFELAYGLGSGQWIFTAMAACLLVSAAYMAKHPLDSAVGLQPTTVRRPGEPGPDHRAGGEL